MSVLETVKELHAEAVLASVLSNSIEIEEEVEEEGKNVTVNQNCWLSVKKKSELLVTPDTIYVIIQGK